MRKESRAILGLSGKTKYFQLNHIPKKNTLSDANMRCDAEVFGSIYNGLLQQYGHFLLDSRIKKVINKQIEIFNNSTISLFKDVQNVLDGILPMGKRKVALKLHSVINVNETIPKMVWKCYFYRKSSILKEIIHKAAEIFYQASYAIAFTGAGISVESGIPPFRGKGGLWSDYDPMILDLTRYHYTSHESWPVIKRLFFDFFGNAKPNSAHKILADWENKGIIKTIITQNIDNLHQEAGSQNVLEYHGNSRQFVCVDCGEITPVNALKLTDTPPACPSCGKLLKPDFIFFGENIPEPAGSLSIEEAIQADVILVVGTSGEIIPASYIPYKAKEYGAKIIEINTEESQFTHSISDIFLQGKAGEILPEINHIINQKS